MNNTQQAGDTANPWPFIGYAPGNYQNTCRICNKDMIADKLCFMCLECAVVSAKGYIGNLESQLDRLPTPAPDAVEAKAEKAGEMEYPERIGSNYPIGGGSPEPIDRNEYDREIYIKGYLTGHAEGQKATVEAKSAGVMGNTADRTKVIGTSKNGALWIGTEGNTTDNKNAEWLNETISHAEGENVSCQIIDHLEILRQHINGRDLGQTQNEHNSMLAGVSYQLSEIIKQHGAVADAEGEKGAVGFAEWTSAE